VNCSDGLTVLHVADCHLGAGEGDGSERAFARLIDLAASARPDALVIAGDLFDSARVSQATVAWTATQLNRLQCDSVILPGNHDALLPASPYEAHQLVERCRAATVITARDGECVHLAGGRIVVWGRPVVEHAPWFHPLAGVPSRPPRAAAAVIVAHGLFVDHDGEESVRGSPIYRAQLAAAADWDYIALGHWPRYREVHSDPPAIYAGELAPGMRRRGSAVLVRFERGRAQPLRWSL
jgi:DNA repair exonuclease SbcCD nuclease subunit